jgi:hypothetical protein
MRSVFPNTTIVRAAGVSLMMLFAGFSSALAAEVTLLYTGETHAMLYPCSCPIETDGGIARRSALIKTIRKSSSNVLLVDSGAFFAGGLMDEYTQSTELDIARTQIAFNAMGRMKYDAAALGDEEFNFGRKFLEDSLRSGSVPVLSVNVECPNVSPFIIKELQGVKVGIIGATPLSAAAKSGGLPVIEPKTAIARAISDVKARGADIVVLLSHLGETDDLELIKAVDGIDVVVIGNGRSKQETHSMVGKTLVLRPSWQGRHMGKAVLLIKDRQIADYKVEDIRLSESVADDKEILAMEPQCFVDTNCRKGPRKGSCQNPGQKNALCVFSQDVKVPVSVVAPKNCPTCQTEGAIASFKSKFPGIEVTRVIYPGPQAQQMIKDFKIKTLPAFIFGKSIEQDPVFPEMKDRLDLVGGQYIMKPQYGGVAVLLDRKFIENRIDVFLSLYDPNITMLLFNLEEFNPQLHFLAAHKDGQIVTVKGIAELEEMKRGVCVKKYYPAYFWNYLNCRIRSIESTWWENCMGDLDSSVISTCAQGAEGSDLLNQNIALTEELQIVSSPTYVVNNQNIFSSKTPPSKEEFRKIFKSK